MEMSEHYIEDVRFPTKKKRLLILTGVCTLLLLLVGLGFLFSVKVKTTASDENRHGGYSVARTNGRTYSGTFPQTSEASCAIPFQYKGQWFHTCTRLGTRIREWCSLTTRYNGSWGFCLRAVSTNAGCVFPFIYKGQRYTHCTDKDSDSFWCSLTHIYDGAYDICVPPLHPPSSCVFPFTYKGATYERCTSRDSEHYWCSLHASYNRKWEYCEPGWILPHVDCVSFQFNGRLYHACTPLISRYHHWCSKERYYLAHYTSNWEYCADLTMIPNVRCQMPFKYQGRDYQHCIPQYSDNSHWCSGTYEYSGEWYYCATPANLATDGETRRFG